jgi:hypothetical protein
MTRPYRPRSNGTAERVIQSALREWVNGFTYQHSKERTMGFLRWTTMRRVFRQICPWWKKDAEVAMHREPDGFAVLCSKDVVGADVFQPASN